MDAATAALVGVALGAIVPALTTVYSTRREDARADRLTDEAREARLFDHRREAYRAFAAACRAREIGDDAVPFEEVQRLWADVGLYGTTEADEIAGHVVFGLEDQGGSTAASLGDFLEQARRDLGVR